MADQETYAYLRVEQEIEKRIASGDLGPGERLPSLRAMGARMGMSVGTIVAAYAELERKGLAESRPRSGFFVRAAPRALPRPSEPKLLPVSAELVSRSALIRHVLEALGRSSLLPLGLSLPQPELLPVAPMGRILSQAMRELGGRALDYAPVQGLPELRRQIALRIMDAGADARPSEAVVTSGAVEALSIALRCVARPGDSVVIASPTYYCLLELLETQGVRAIEVPCHPRDGVNPADVAEAAARFAVAALVLIPNFNNPDGSLMPDAAKAEIAALAARRGLPIIEDDVYGELAFGQRRPSMLRAHAPDPGMVLSVGSFSKTLAPGFRVGWLLPGRFMDKALQLKATTTVCTATPTQAAVAEFLSRGGYDRHLRSLRAALKAQVRAMRAAVGLHFPAGTRVSDPEGGMQLWVELPEGADSIDFFMKARAMGIGVCPGVVFSPTDRYRNFLRLCCGVAWGQEVEQAVARLGALATELAGV